jgi:hypothetical protein
MFLAFSPPPDSNRADHLAADADLNLQRILVGFGKHATFTMGADAD